MKSFGFYKVCLLELFPTRGSNFLQSCNDEVMDVLREKLKTAIGGRTPLSPITVAQWRMKPKNVDIGI